MMRACIEVKKIDDLWINMNLKCPVEGLEYVGD